MDTQSTLLTSIADQLDKWAAESRSGGWSTHQVNPMRELAAGIREGLAKRAADATAAAQQTVKHTPEIQPDYDSFMRLVGELSRWRDEPLCPADHVAGAICDVVRSMILAAAGETERGAGIASPSSTEEGCRGEVTPSGQPPVSAAGASS